MPRQYGITGEQSYAAAPAVGVAGASYFDTTLGEEFVSNGSVWQSVNGLSADLIGRTLLVQTPAGAADTGTQVVIKGMSGQFGKSFFAVQQSDGSEITTISSGIQSWFNGSMTVSWDFWMQPSNANVNCRAGTGAASALRAVRDVASAAGSHVVEFGTRSGTTDTVNGYITQEGTISAPKVTGLGAPSAGSDAANKTYVDSVAAANEVTVQAGPSTPGGAPLDLWVDTADTGVWTTGLTYSDIRSTAGLTATTTVTLVPGTQFTMSANGPNDVFLCLASADMTCTATGGTAQAYLYVDGVETSPTGRIIFAATAINQRGTYYQHWIVTGLAAGAHTYELRGNLTGGGYTINTLHTHLSVIKIAG